MRCLAVLTVLLAGCGGPQPAEEEPAEAPAKAQTANFRPPQTAPANRAARSSEATHPCKSQEGRPVNQELKALGTEPFWAAEVDGRCVTYRTPEDQKGIRVWTRVVEEPDATFWNGAMDNRQFQLRVRLATCSDGMSDRTYPMEAVLRVRGEARRGCAAPASPPP